MRGVQAGAFCTPRGAIRCSRSIQSARKAPTDPVYTQRSGLSWSRLGGGLLGLALTFGGAAPAAALLCSTANPAIVPGGTVLNSTTPDCFNNILVQTPTLRAPARFYRAAPLTRFPTIQPFLAGRTFLYNPNQPQVRLGRLFLATARAVARSDPRTSTMNSSPCRTCRPLRATTPSLWSLSPAERNFGAASPVQLLTSSTGLFWGSGGGTQYFVGRRSTGSCQSR